MNSRSGVEANEISFCPVLNQSTDKRISWCRLTPVWFSSTPLAVPRTAHVPECAFPRRSVASASQV